MAKKRVRSAELVRRMDRLWGAEARAPRGPRPALTLDRVVRRAIEIADRNGLPSVTMQRLARRMGVTTMALYRYVSSKAELIDLMVESALGTPPVIDPDAGWRSNLARWAREHLGLYHRHPWALGAFVAAPFGPNQIAWFDVALAALAETRTSPGERIAIVSLLDDYVRGAAQLQLTVTADPEFTAWYAQSLSRAAGDGRFPRVAELHTAGAFAPDRGWDPFGFGIERVLDGIAVLLDTRAGRSARARSARRRASP